jgi:hypothetical protein
MQHFYRVTTGNGQKRTYHTGISGAIIAARGRGATSLYHEHPGYPGGWQQKHLRPDPDARVDYHIAGITMADLHNIVQRITGNQRSAYLLDEKAEPLGAITAMRFEQEPAYVISDSTS